MPFYTYNCPDCQKKFDLQRNVNQRDDATDCPWCGSNGSSRSLALPMVYSREAGGQARVLAGASGCGSCAATSCGSCGVN